jgi:hypothetical protein
VDQVAHKEFKDHKDRKDLVDQQVASADLKDLVVFKDRKDQVDHRDL